MYPPAVADRYPDRVAYIMAGSGETLTYSQLDRDSNRLAHLFRQHGIRSGDTVAVVLENRIEWPLVVAAGMRSGLYVTPLNWHLNPAELAQLLADARPRVLITSAALAADLASITGDRSGIATWCVDGDPETPENHEGFANLRVATAAQPTTPIEDESLGARVLYSGGTTGRPKAFRQKLLGVPQVKLDIMQWWGPILHEYYGACEGYGHTYISPDEALVRPGSAGRPLSGARIHVTDPDGNELPAGQAGRVCFAAPAGVAYRNAGDEQAPELRGMGDVGYVDAEGFLFLVGRETSTIISGGVNIYPPEIEAVLVTHPDIIDASVVGEPDPEFGERVVAVVEPRPGTDSAALSEELVELCRERLAHFKAPRRVVVVDRLPRRPNGKLNTDGVRALVRSGKENT